MHDHMTGQQHSLLLTGEFLQKKEVYILNAKMNFCGDFYFQISQKK
jgi:hypothetical protein